jgi:predicted metalloendopeptidase
VILTVLIALSALLQPVAATQVATPGASPVATPTAGHGIAPSNMDLSVDPAEDFYRFANGGWLDRTEIPADEGAYGVFQELDDLTIEQLLELLDERVAGGDLPEGTDEWKAVQLYAQGTDIDARNADGIDPIQPILDEIDAVTTLEELHAFQRDAIFHWLTGLFNAFVIPDLANSSMYGTYLSGPFFGLPNRDYYLEDDPANEAVREAYIAANTDFLMLAGYNEQEAAATAQAVFDLERQLVEPTLTREQQQDISLFYNPMTIAELQAAYPRMDWDTYLADLGLVGVEQVIVTEKGYLEALDAIVASADLEVLKAYFTLEVFWSFAEYLSEDVERIAFDFQGGALAGVEEQAPLEERVLEDVNAMVPDAVGKLYVEEHFPPEAKAEITELTETLIAAYRARLEANPWMTEETRAAAIDKLDQMVVKVGYPDEWHAYEAVEIQDSYMQSALSGLNAETRRQLDRAGEPVDREEWTVAPQVVNAFYSPQTNSITFPAAILQPPFFDFRADPAVNFGGIGFVIGHELTHGFDLQGAQFDAEGNLANWWSPADATAFQELNDAAVAQYSEIEVLPGVFIDGQITVPENVADLGGTQIAYDGLQMYLDTHGDPGEIDGFTQEQRFFISAATVWREEIRDELLTTQVKTDVHAPAQARATQPIRNMDAFHEAFDIEPGDPMYLAPEDRLVIW